MKKIAVVAGARPQFIKLSPLIDELSGKAKLILIHTGQHYDFEMSDIFFNQLKLPEPDYHLGVGSMNQASQVGSMMVKLEEVLLEEKPDLAAVIGDTNSTLAGALTAAKNRIPLAHIEAGLRSKNSQLPEQINRVVTDRLSQVLCCPDRSSMHNLKAEGIEKGVYLTGDILYDLLNKLSISGERVDRLLEMNNLEPDNFILLTVHRAENVDNREFLESLIKWLGNVVPKIFFPVHPRTEKNLKQFGLYERLRENKNLIVSKPVGIVESLALTGSALGMITDSGGLQREAAYFGKKAYILRDETEWLELERCGAVQCIGIDFNDIQLKWHDFKSPGEKYFQVAAKNISRAFFEYLV
jgi:UDP-N-acetylglucosamine 2-epimerase